MEMTLANTASPATRRRRSRFIGSPADPVDTRVRERVAQRHRIGGGLIAEGVVSACGQAERTDVIVLFGGAGAVHRVSHVLVNP